MRLLVSFISNLSRCTVIQSWSWADKVNYTLRKAWKALHFIMRILKKGNNNSKRLAYTALVRPILEYGAVCWERTEKVRHAVETGCKREWLNLQIIERSLFRKLWRSLGWICVFRRYSLGGRAWKALASSLLIPYSLFMEDHNGKMRTRI